MGSQAYGYICESYGQPFQLPELGPIGANGLANPRHFAVPTAKFEEKSGPTKFVRKYQGKLWQAELSASPFDVVGWHGNYVPYKYDLSKFNTINTVSYDHPDPSIFTVLTSQTAHAGVANIDFVIFPPRWMVARETFRPPYYHRNIMSEFMGLIHGVYDAKPSGGFSPGGSSLHNCMVPHGPDGGAYQAGLDESESPNYIDNTLAFMFESSLVFNPTEFALNCSERQTEYWQCWQNIPVTFDGKN